MTKQPPPKKMLPAQLQEQWTKDRAAIRGIETLVAVAIIRDGKLNRTASKGQHWEIRSKLGDDDPTKSNPCDLEGFVTNMGNFVDRVAAHNIALASGQIIRPIRRGLISSDLDW